MTKICGHTTPCGCGDTPLTTPAACTAAEPQVTDPCAETFCTDCVAYCGEDMKVNTSAGTLIVKQGTRVAEFMQTVMRMMNNPDDIIDGIDNFRVITKTSTTITVAWKEKDTQGIGYYLECEYGNEVVTFHIADGTTYLTIENLPVDTECELIMEDSNTGGNSVTLIVKTNEI